MSAGEDKWVPPPYEEKEGKETEKSYQAFKAFIRLFREETRFLSHDQIWAIAARISQTRIGRRHCLRSGFTSSLIRFKTKLPNSDGICTGYVKVKGDGRFVMRVSAPDETISVEKDEEESDGEEEEDAP